MSKARFGIVLVAVVVAVPGTVSGVEAPGSCLIGQLDPPAFDACIDGVENSEVCEGIADGLTFVFTEGGTCADFPRTQFSWDGCCCLPESAIPEAGAFCGLIDSSSGEEACLDGPDGARWFPGEFTSCEAVPTLPVVGSAVLALMILGGALVVLRPH